MPLEMDVSLIYKAIGFVIIFILTIVIGKVSERMFKSGMRRVGVPETESVLLSTSLKYIIYFFGTVEALTFAGVSFIPFMFAIAIAAVVLGISSRSIIEDVVSGYLLRIYNPFNIGDTIKIGDKVGTVKDLDLMKTTIETVSKQFYTIPNSRVISSEMVNFTKYKSKFPVELEISIPFSTDVEKAKIAILEILKNYRNLCEEMPIYLYSRGITDKGVITKVKFYVPHYYLTEGAKDFLINNIVKNLKLEEIKSGKGQQQPEKARKTLKLEGEGKTKKTRDVQPCPMCNSKGWIGYLRCDLCSGYYLRGKCIDCDHLRMDRCPVDGGKLEYLPIKQTTPKVTDEIGSRF